MMTRYQLKWADILFFAVLTALALRFFIVTNHEVNWDEFFFLSQIYEYNAGTLHKALQTIHVHFFGWLPTVPGNETDQVIAARFIMLFMQAVTIFFIYKISRYFFSHEAALFGALSYLCFTYVIWQGASFRTDPIATALLMGCLYIFLYHPRSYIGAGLAGILVGFAGMVTMKAVFYVPVLGLVLLVAMINAEDRKRHFSYALLALIAALVVFAALYILHKLSLPSPGGAENSVSLITRSYEKTINLDNPFPKIKHFFYSLPRDIGFWFFCVAGMVYAAFGVKAGRLTKAQATILLSLALPLLTLVFYRNSFPYYYVFMLAPVSVLCAAGWQAFVHQRGRIFHVVLGAGILFGLLNLVVHGYLKTRMRPLDTQRMVLAQIHDIFPEPVPYIDRGGMVASFPHAGFFMTTWGLEKYRADGRPVLLQAMREKQPKFMLANIFQLDYAHYVIREKHKLLEADRQALRENYVPFWGPLYLPGKQFHFESPRGFDDSNREEFSILIAGPYTIKATTPVIINGKSYLSGEILQLNTGTYTIETRTAADVTLLWGRNIKAPEQEPPQESLFTWF